MTSGIRCMILRGGTSKGAYFLADDLPIDEAERDELLLRIMGTPDSRQIDGIGGANPLTSKVAVVSAADEGSVPTSTTCSSRSGSTNRWSPTVRTAATSWPASDRLPWSGVSSASITDATEALIRIRMINTDSIATASFPVAGGQPVYAGDTAISGVPGTAATIRLDFEDIAGGSCGALLPTGNPVDEIDGVECTLIDNGMPVVVMAASALGIDGHENCADLEANDELRRRLESIRLKAGPLMNLGDVSDTSVPKLTMVSEPRSGGHLNTRTFIPHRCHDAIGVLGAVSVATAAMLPGSPAAGLLTSKATGPPTGGVVTVEHPTGVFDAAIEVDIGDDGHPEVRRAGIIRTARKLMDGVVFPREYP